MKFTEVKIDIDEEVMGYLKKNAIPFEDTPNTVLRRILGIANRRGGQVLTGSSAAVPTTAPAALQQILEVYVAYRNNGGDRIMATNLVARKRGITPQSVIDKYARQLGKCTSDIDRLMRPENAEEFASILKERFPMYATEIDSVLKI